MIFEVFARMQTHYCWQSAQTLYLQLLGSLFAKTYEKLSNLRYYLLVIAVQRVQRAQNSCSQSLRTVIVLLVTNLIKG